MALLQGALKEGVMESLCFGMAQFFLRHMVPFQHVESLK